MVFGSRPVICCTEPEAFPTPERTFEATATAGALAIASPALGEIESNPFADTSMYDDFTCRSIARRFDCFMPLASTAMKVTSASPIMSAAAVAAVRPGFLRVFSPDETIRGRVEADSGRSLANPRPRSRRITESTTQTTSTTSVTPTATMNPQPIAVLR